MDTVNSDSNYNLELFDILVEFKLVIDMFSHLLYICFAWYRCCLTC